MLAMVLAMLPPVNFYVEATELYASAVADEVATEDESNPVLDMDEEGTYYDDIDKEYYLDGEVNDEVTCDEYIDKEYYPDDEDIDLEYSPNDGANIEADPYATGFYVIFNPNGGTYLTGHDRRPIGHDGRIIGALPWEDHVLLPGYALWHWNTMQNGSGNVFTADTQVPMPVTADFNVFAQWGVFIQFLCLVSDLYVGGDRNDPADWSNRVVPRNSTVANTSGQVWPNDPPQRFGYTFDGWFSGNTRITETTNIDANTTVTARWEPYTIYTVNFNPSGGIVTGEATRRAFAGSSIFATNDPDRFHLQIHPLQPNMHGPRGAPAQVNWIVDGGARTVAGWYTQPNGQGTWFAPPGNYSTLIGSANPTAPRGHSMIPIESSMVDGNGQMTVYANWVYRVFFNNNAGNAWPVGLGGMPWGVAPQGSSHPFNTIWRDIPLSARGGNINNDSFDIYTGTTGMPANPTRDGHTFGGWFFNPANPSGTPSIPTGQTPPAHLEEFTGTTPINGSMGVSAFWIPAAGVTVTFNVNSGLWPTIRNETLPYDGSPRSISLVGGTSMGMQTGLRQPNPVRPGYIFAGWHSDPDFVMNAFPSPTPPVTGSIHTFDGTNGRWFGMGVLVQSSVSVYAIWVPGPGYRVTVNPNGGSWDRTIPHLAAYFETGYRIIWPGFSFADMNSWTNMAGTNSPSPGGVAGSFGSGNEGHMFVTPPANRQFMGWNTQPDGLGDMYHLGNTWDGRVSTPIHGDRYLYALWTTHVTFNNNWQTYGAGANSTQTRGLIYGASFATHHLSPNARFNTGFANPIEPLRVPTAGTWNSFSVPGRIFVGWNIQPDGNGAWFDPLLPRTQHTEDRVYYAIWGLGVVFNPGIAASNVAPMVRPLPPPNMPLGNDFPANPVWLGRTFTGWFSDGSTLFTRDTVIPGQLTLTARWRADITFLPNAASVTGVPALPIAHPLTEYAGHPMNELMPVPSRTNWDFYAWNTAANGLGNYYRPNTLINIDRRLYAQWNALVTFDLDGGTIPGSPSLTRAVRDGRSISGMGLSLPANPQRGADIFQRWVIADGFPGAGQVFNENTHITVGRLTVIAEYTSPLRDLTIANQPASVGPSGQMSGGSFAPGTQIPLASGTVVNRTFLGWWRSGLTPVPGMGTTVNSGHAQFIPPGTSNFEMPGESVTLTALWGNDVGVIGGSNAPLVVTAPSWNIGTIVYGHGASTPTTLNARIQVEIRRHATAPDPVQNLAVVGVIPPWGTGVIPLGTSVGGNTPFLLDIGVLPTHAGNIGQLRLEVGSHDLTTAILNNNVMFVPVPSVSVNVVPRQANMPTGTSAANATAGPVSITINNVADAPTPRTLAQHGATTGDIWSELIPGGWTTQIRLMQGSTEIRGWMDMSVSANRNFTTLSSNTVYTVEIRHFANNLNHLTSETLTFNVTTGQEPTLTIGNVPGNVAPVDGQMSGGQVGVNTVVSLVPGSVPNMTFLGWWQGAGAPSVGTNVTTLISNPQFLGVTTQFTMPANNETLTALWGDQANVIGNRNAHQLTISNSPAGLIVTGGQTTSGFQIAGDAVTLVSGNVANMIFMGWWQGTGAPTSGTPSGPQFLGIVSSIVMPDASTTLTALWGNGTDIGGRNTRQLTIENAPSGLTVTGNQIISGPHTAGDTVTLVSGSVADWVFMGWWQGAGAPTSGPPPSVPQFLGAVPSIIMPDSDTTLIALWGDGLEIGNPNFFTLNITVNGPVATADIVVVHGNTTFVRNGNVFTARTADPLIGVVTASAPRFTTNTGIIPVYSNGIANLTITLQPYTPPLGRGAIQGFVTRYNAGTPIVGATVVAVDTSGIEVARMATSVTGEYLFSNLIPGTYRVIVAHEGYVPESRDVAVVANNITIANFVLESVIGPVPNYVLIVNLVNVGNAPGIVMLDGNNMPLVNGVWSQSGNTPVTGIVTAVAVGFLPSAQYTITNTNFVSNSIYILNITLVPDDGRVDPGELRGFVRQASNRITPIPNATVTAIHSDGTRHVTQTDEFGFYRFPNLPVGTYTVLASAAGFNNGMADSQVTILTGGDGVHTNVYLDHGSLAYTVIINVEPVGAAAGASLTFLGQPLDHIGGNRWTFVMNRPFMGLLQVESPGFEIDVRMVGGAAAFVNGIADITVRLRPVALEGTLQGDVFEYGTQNRLAGATVEAVNNETGVVSTTQADIYGFFIFTNLPLGSYTVVAHATGFVANASSNSPVTLPVGSGVHENVFLERIISGVNDFSLLVTVIGPAADNVTITMPSVTLNRIGTTNVWRADRNTQMLGLITANAPLFRAGTFNVVPASYTSAGVAHVVMVMEEIDAIVRFHFGISGMPYIEIPLENLNQPIPTALIPTVPTRYGSLNNPGWAFMGWYVALFERMHYINNLNRVDYRTDAFNLAQNITEAMLTDGVLNLYASWLQFGDVTGDGSIGTIDQMLVQSYFLRLIPADRLIRRTADVNLDGGINTIDQMMIQSHFLRMPVILGPQPQ